MALSAGVRLGPYELVEPLGSGGMGEVYRARDPRLGRDVAIKVVLAAAEPDPDRLRRFEDEARAVAALSHPNVLTVHDVGSHEGRPFLVLELLEGETLRERLERGPLPLRRAIEVAVEVCRGLDAAHSHGLVHRDLKPENLFLTSDGRVKILDFGLAKLTRGDVESGLLGAAPPGEKDTKTAPGIILGTLGYLAPEQARGLGADARSDLFALGAVLYEMVSGRRAFSGRAPADTLAAILHSDPPAMTSASGPTPPALDQVVHKCLAKELEQRFRSAHDLALALEAVLDPGRALPAAGSPSIGLVSATRETEPRRRGRAELLAAALAVAGCAVGLAWWVVQQDPESAVLQPVPLTTDPGMENWPSFSPDGSQIAFQGPAEGDVAAIHVKQVGEEASLPRTSGPGLDHAASWSPDGRWIAFLRGEAPLKGPLQLMLVPPVAGPEREITRIDAPVGWGARPAWTPDSRALVVPDREGAALTYSLYRISIDDGRRTRWTFSDESAPGEGDLDPAISPDGTRLAFVRNGDLHLVDIDDRLRPSGRPRQLADLGGPARSHELSGPWGLAWTADSREIVFSAGVWPQPRLFRVSADGGPIRALAGVAAGTFAPAISRAGSRLAYMEWITSADIWQLRLDDGRNVASEPTRLIRSSRLDTNPVHSPDGERIAFHSIRKGRYGVWIASASGSDPRPLEPHCQLGDAATPERAFSWSPDQQAIVLAAEGDLFVVDVPSGACRALTTGPAVDESPIWSPDGLRVYFGSRVDGVWQVVRIPASGGQATPVTRSGGRLLAVSPDGRQLYYSHDEKLWTIPAAGGDPLELLDPVPDHVAATERGFFHVRNSPDNRIEYFDLDSRDSRFVAKQESYILGLSVAPDGSHLVYALIDHARADLMLVEDFR